MIEDLRNTTVVQSNSFFSGHLRTSQDPVWHCSACISCISRRCGNCWCPRHGRFDRLFDLCCPMYLTVDQQHSATRHILSRLHKITLKYKYWTAIYYIKHHKTIDIFSIFKRNQFPSIFLHDYWYWWLMACHGDISNGLTGVEAYLTGLFQDLSGHRRPQRNSSNRR